MLKIKVTTQFRDWPLERQTPGSKSIWRNCVFYINKNIEDCDYWIVLEGLEKTETTVCNPDNTILITGEPPIQYIPPPI